MIKVLLTGSSGTVGSEVLKQLCEIPELDITVFDKNTKASKKVFSSVKCNIKVVYGDISSKEDVFKVCCNKDIIIHLAGIIPPLADKCPNLARNVNVLGTKNIIEGIEELSPNAFLIYSSSISVYGDRNHNPWINVNDNLNPSGRDEYAKTKIEAESLITKSKIKWTIFRLTAIMGVSNHKSSSIMFHMPLDTKMEICTPADTARAFVNAINNQSKLVNNIFNLGGGPSCRIIYEDFLSRSFNIFGLGKLNFSKNSFANKNFHCGYYEDGDILNNILDFRKNSIEDYFNEVKKSINIFKKIFTILLRKIIKHNLQKQSEPLNSKNKNIIEEIKYYFKNTEDPG